MSSEKKRVQFRASNRLIDRTDALADVLGEDRTDILVTALRDYLHDAAHDDTVSQEIDTVTLANEVDAAGLLCDEFNSLGQIHASLANTRLVTTPTLLSVFVRADQLAATEARSLLDQLCGDRSWETNSYVQRVRCLQIRTHKNTRSRPTGRKVGFV